MRAVRADVLIRVTCALALHALLWTILLSPGDGQSADAQKRQVRIGFVGPESPSTTVSGVAAFWQRLHELGWVDGQNVAVEARWTEGHSERLPKAFAEIVQRNLDVLITYSTPAAVAAKKASSTVPIVVAGMADPVGSKLAGSLAKPGANLTGLSLGYSEGFSGKWLEMLRETVPQLTTVGIIWNPTNPADIELRRKTVAAAAGAGVQLRFIDLRTPDRIEEAFRKARQVAQAIVVLPDPITVNNRQRIVEITAELKLPSIYVFGDFVQAGGLMSYGVDQTFLFRRAAEYVDMILSGAKPGDIPIEEPTQFSTAVNLRAAKQLGLTIPESILLRADHVIR